jgi:hypothetical protein
MAPLVGTSPVVISHSTIPKLQGGPGVAERQASRRVRSINREHEAACRESSNWDLVHCLQTCVVKGCHACLYMSADTVHCCPVSTSGADLRQRR